MGDSGAVCLLWRELCGVAHTAELCPVANIIQESLTETASKEESMIWRCRKCTLANAKSCAACELRGDPRPNSGEATDPWKCHGCYLENAHIANACGQCGQARPKKWRRFMCGANTTSPHRIRDPDCPHRACALHCLQELRSRWVDIKAELRSMDGTLPLPKRRREGPHEGDKAQ